MHMLHFDSKPPYRRGYLPAANAAEWLLGSGVSDSRWLRTPSAVGAGEASRGLTDLVGARRGTDAQVARVPASRSRNAGRSDGDSWAGDAWAGSASSVAGSRVAVAEEVDRRRSAVARRHVHCIVDGRPGPALLQLMRGAASGLGTRISAVGDGHLTAVLTDGSPRGGGGGGRDPSAHELVIQAAARDHTVIPFIIDSTVGSEEDVLDLLRGTRAALGDLLGRVRGKVEMALVVRWDRERVVAEIEGRNAELRALRESIVEAERAATYWDRMRLARLIESALEERVRAYAADVRSALGRCCVAATPRVGPAGGDDVVLDVALLVKRTRVGGLMRRVGRLSERYAGRLSFECSGLGPPSSFVKLKLRLESSS